MQNKLIPGLLLILSIACQPNKPKEQETTAAEVDVITTPQLIKVWETDTLLTTAESVIYDQFRDVLYVSNINGVPPTAKDDDGFISIVSTNGDIINLNWVSEISAPKGMGIVDSSLYVTNIDEIVEIDIPSGVIVKRYPIAGSQFLNDITTSADGDVFISDSNLSNIYLLKAEEATLWLNDTSFHGSNGLLHEGNHIMVASFGGGEFYRVDINTQMKETLSDSIMGGDGVVAYDKHYFVSSWNGEVHFVTDSGESTMLLDTKAAGLNAADIYYLSDKKMLLVPTFFGNTVAAYQVK